MMTAEQENVAWIKFERGLIKVCDSDDPKAFAVYKWATVESYAAAQLAKKEREIASRVREVESWVAKWNKERDLREAAEQRLQEAQATNRELNRRNQSLEKSLNAESGRKSWHGYFTADLRERLRQREAELEQARKHLYIHHICTHDEYVGALRPRVPSPPKEAKVAGEDAGRE